MPPSFLDIQTIWSRIAADLHSVSAWRQASTFLSFLSFWAAITLPAVYLPLLVTRLDTPQELVVFMGLFLLHVVALLGGQHYRAST